MHQARDLWARLDRPKRDAQGSCDGRGIPAVEQLTADGINVNITLLFSLDRYRQVIDAYLAGLQARVNGGDTIGTLSRRASSTPCPRQRSAPSPTTALRGWQSTTSPSRTLGPCSTSSPRTRSTSTR
ncbi:MAG: hypothetical protein HYX32_05925 [Actinobacteria bacterium]|nr:hypothetical protein [Actinomycetota bacterium]